MSKTKSSSEKPKANATTSKPKAGKAKATNAKAKSATGVSKAKAAKPSASKETSNGKQVKAALKKRASNLAVSPEERQRMIAEAAYYHALARDFQGGDTLGDWLQAEQEISRTLSGQRSHVL